MKRNGYYDVDGKFYSKDKKERKVNPLAPRGSRHFHSHYFDGTTVTTSCFKNTKAVRENDVDNVRKLELNNRTRRQIIILTVALSILIIIYIVVMTAISFMGLLW